MSARVLRAAAVCRQRGITQSQVAMAVGASQSQISRILSGRSERGSRLLEEVCLYVERLEGGITPKAVAANRDLMDAICASWDGTAAHARALSAVIRSLAALGPRSEKRSRARAPES